MALLQFLGCGESGPGAARADTGNEGGDGSKAPFVLKPLDFPPLLDYSDKEGTAGEEEVDENVLNSEEEGTEKMEDDTQTDESPEDGGGMDVDGPGTVVSNEVFFPTQDEKGEGKTPDGEKDEKDRRDKEAEEKDRNERTAKAREEKRMRKEEAKKRVNEKRAEEQLRLEEEMRRLEGMRDQARKRATAGVKSRLDGRYYAVWSIRSTRPSGRELNRNRRDEQPYMESVSRVRMRGGLEIITSTTSKGL
jgi:hypothetical protein